MVYLLDYVFVGLCNALISTNIFQWSIEEFRFLRIFITDKQLVLGMGMHMIVKEGYTNMPLQFEFLLPPENVKMFIFGDIITPSNFVFHVVKKSTVDYTTH